MTLVQVSCLQVSAPYLPPWLHQLAGSSSHIFNEYLRVFHPVQASNYCIIATYTLLLKIKAQKCHVTFVIPCVYLLSDNHGLFKSSNHLPSMCKVPWAFSISCLIHTTYTLLSEGQTAEHSCVSSYGSACSVCHTRP